MKKMEGDQRNRFTNVNNALRLNDATNAIGLTTYTFGSNANRGNPSNYQALVLMSNSLFRSTTLTIGTGGSLSGNGTVASTMVSNFGTISPCISTGLLTFTSNLVLGSSSLLRMQIGGNSAVDYDRLVVGGDVTITGKLHIAMINGFSPTVAETFTLFQGGLVSGLFDRLTNNAFIDASVSGVDACFRVQYNPVAGGDVLLLATIPEPSTFMLMTLAALGMLRIRRR